jgi:hypothetical protein
MDIENKEPGIEFIDSVIVTQPPNTNFLSATCDFLEIFFISLAVNIITLTIYHFYF